MTGPGSAATPGSGWGGWGGWASGGSPGLLPPPVRGRRRSPAAGSPEGAAYGRGGRSPPG